MSFPDALDDADLPGLALPDYPDDTPSCELLGPTALVVQALMGVLVILSLVYKRHREKPMRPWRIWLFDVSKQVVGQMFVHGVNVLISDAISQITDGNACVFYFLNILLDTTLGVAFIYGVLHCLTWVLSGKLGLKGFESGVYGDPPSFNYWCRQAAIYVVSLTTMKFLVIALFVIFPFIFKIGDWFLSWTGNGTHIQVIFTMGIFPIVMNVLQFWLIDSIVKAQSNSSVALGDDESDSIDEADREPLFNAPFEDDDDHPNPYHPGDIESRPRSKQSHPSFDSVRSDSHSTEITVPNGDGHKSCEDDPHTSNDRHSYPPSLSSSFTASHSPESKSSKAKARRSSSKQSDRRKSRSLTRSQSHDPTTQTTLHHNLKARAKTPDPAPSNPNADDWAVSWNEGDDDWDAEPSKDQAGPIQDVATRIGGNDVPRTRRLS